MTGTTPGERRDAEIGQFLRAIAETPDLWPAIDVGAVAVRDLGVWYNVITVCRLDPRKPAEVPRLGGLPETDLVACWQEALPAEVLPHLLQQVGWGTLTVAGRNVKMTPYPQAAEVPVVAELHYFEV